MGGDGEQHDQQALGQGDPAERGVAGQPARGVPGRARPARVHGGEKEQQQRGEREPPYEVAVQPPVGPVLAAAPAADDAHHHGGERDERGVQAPAEDVQGRRAAGTAVEGGRGRGDGRGDGEQARGGVGGAQPGHEAAAVPEAGPAERPPGAGLLRLRPAGAGLLRLGVPGHRLLGLVGAPGAVGEVPQQGREGGGDEGGEGETAAGRAPPAAARRRQEAEPGMPCRTRARARALPGGQVEGDLAGGGDEQHGEGEAGQPYEQPVQAHGAGA
ncbi:hypothetical protein GCM10010508_13080 [Streptomyces naganishii JCM 4654]|uniref:Uncharacterized protein n=1 Tax=Streptomyces naganishii JCM 4654 TaxID=1306179 RepID=A0A918Y146_9ACTN|nr:hypothetical protein GCM10010508_13080 [Streptomyces naganishii JCM 4654]